MSPPPLLFLIKNSLTLFCISLIPPSKKYTHGQGEERGQQGEIEKEMVELSWVEVGEMLAGWIVEKRETDIQWINSKYLSIVIEVHAVLMVCSGAI